MEALIECRGGDQERLFNRLVQGCRLSGGHETKSVCHRRISVLSQRNTVVLL